MGGDALIVDRFVPSKNEICLVFPSTVIVDVTSPVQTPRVFVIFIFHLTSEGGSMDYTSLYTFVERVEDNHNHFSSTLTDTFRKQLNRAKSIINPKHLL